MESFSGSMGFSEELALLFCYSLDSGLLQFELCFQSALPYGYKRAASSFWSDLFLHSGFQKESFTFQTIEDFL